MPLAIEFSGPLDEQALRRAFQVATTRHAALRTRFVDTFGRLMRTECATVPNVLVDHDACGPRLEDALGGASSAPVELLGWPPYRAALRRLSEHHHLALFVFHHCVFDGLSKDLLIAEIARAYAGALAGERPEPVRAREYATYVRDEAEWIEAQQDGAARYWEPRFPHLIESAPLPLPLGARGDLGGDTDFVAIPPDPELKRALLYIAEHYGVSEFSALLAAVQVLQHWYGGDERAHIATAIPMSTRTADWRDTIGMFVNLAPLVCTPPSAQRFGPFVRHVSDQLRALSGLRRYPFPEAMSRFGPTCDPRSIAAQVCLSYRRSQRRTPTPPRGLELSRHELLPIHGREWPFDLRVLDEPDGIRAILGYHPELVGEAAARDFVACLQRVIRTVARDSDAGVSKLASDAAASAGGSRVEPRRPGLTVQQLFETQVARTPNATAVRFEAHALTYRALDDRANRLSRRLRKAGAARGAVVALAVERSFDLVAGVLGIIKSGATYLPLDVRLPRDRIAFMLSDSAATIVVTEQRFVAHLPLQGRTVVVASAESEASGRQMRRARGRVDDIAYVIYTSGSTGRPKGVRIRHESLTNLLVSMTAAPGIEPGDSLLAITSPSFDIAALELLLPLVVGAQVIIAPTDAVADGHALAALLRRSGATILQATPTTWRALLDAGWSGSLKALSGGERLTADLAQRLLPRVGELWNLYGPTETTIWSTLSRVDDPQDISVGRPIANTQVYVLSRGMRPLPSGIPGELCIGGVGVADGYVDRPELTADRFVSDPFSASPGRLYRTGDRARWREDANLELLDRLDDQVKVRGHRVELGEVEHAMLQLSGVKHAAVVPYETAAGETQLVACVVPVSGKTETPAALRTRLSTVLPAAMVPSRYTVLTELPRMLNGKLDRQRLKQLATVEPADVPAREPMTVLERSLSAIWVKVLGITELGADHNFFDAGGSSLKAAEVAARVRSTLAMECSVRLVFDHPTIASMALALEHRDIADGE